jgi:hypothetical protein
MMMLRFRFTSNSQTVMMISFSSLIITGLSLQCMCWPLREVKAVGFSDDMNPCSERMFGGIVPEAAVALDFSSSPRQDVEAPV